MNLELKELREEKAELGKEIRRLADLNTDPTHQWTAQEEESWQRVNNDYNEVLRRIAVGERAEQVARELDEGPQAPRETGQRPEGGSDPGLWRGRSTGRRAMITEEDRSLALQAWCRHQRGLELREEHQAAVRLTGTQLHAQEFIIELPRGSRARAMRAMIERERRQMSTAATEGGDTIPEGFVYNFEKALLYVGGTRQAATILPTDSGAALPWPTTNDTGQEGALLAENAQATQQAVATGVMTLEAYKYTSKIILVSNELLEDTAFDLASELGRMAGERIGRALEGHLTTGDGSSKPNGIVTASTLGKTAASATAITADEIIDLIHSVDPAYRNGAAFMMHDNIILAIRKLKASGSGDYIWQPGAQEGVPDRLFGYPLYVNQKMDGVIDAASKVILFGQMKKYIVRDVRFVRLKRMVERYADYDQEGFVAFSRHDGDLLDAGTHPIRHLITAAS